MQECYNWETNTLDFKDLNGTIFHLKLKGTKTIVGGKAGTGKTLICNKLLDIICDDNIDMKPYNASNVFVLTQENRHLLYEQNHKLVIVDRADMILNESEIEFINNDTSTNRYLLFARAPLGIYLSPNYFAELVRDGMSIEIKYQFDEIGWN